MRTLRARHRETKSRVRWLTRAWALCGILMAGVPPKSWAGTLEEGRVYPKIISPNGDGFNDYVYFEVNNPTLDSIEGKIADVSGATVADLVVSSNGPSADTLMWDGRDRSGRVVPVGTYLYRIETGGTVLSGVVVVAR